MTDTPEATPVTVNAADAAAKRKKRLKTTLYILGGVFLVLLAAFIYYLMTQRPVTRVVPGLNKSAPRYVKAIYNDGFIKISDVAANRNGTRIYVLDPSAFKVWALNADGTVLFSFGQPVNLLVSLEGFALPTGLAVGPKDEIYVVDRGRAKISVYSPTGKFVKFFTPSGGEDTAWSPLTAAVDSNGDVYVADAKKDQNRIIVMNKSGKILRTFGTSGAGKGQFAFPNGIALTKDRVYVADSNNARVQAFDKKGKYLFSFRPAQGTELTHPLGIDATRSGEVILVESFGHQVQSYTPEGGGIYTFGTIGISNGQLRYPEGIAITPNGRVFVADTGNNRIQVWQY